MYRYCLIPLILLGIGFVFLPFCFIEANAVYVATEVAQGMSLVHFDAEFWSFLAGIVMLRTSLWSLVIGIVLSIAVAVWDTFRNSLSDRSGARTARRLLSNLCWCGTYALLANVFNGLLIVGVHLTKAPALRSVVNDIVGIAPILTVSIINLVAFLWAVTRSINATDVLTPRALINKVQRSTRLQH